MKLHRSSPRIEGRRLAAALALLPLLLAACAADVSATAEGAAATTDQALGLGAIGSPPKKMELPPPGSTCPAVNPGCSLSPFVGTGFDATLARLHCGAALHYVNGHTSGVLGGIVSLCPDTPAVHAQFGFAPDACDACLAEPPPGMLYVYVETWVGPNCQSGCGRRVLGGGGG